MLRDADHVVYFVDDLQRAKRFYSETLGLPVKFEYPGFVGIDLGPIWLGLHPRETQDTGAAVCGMIYLSVDNLQQALTELKNRGVTIHREASVVGDGCKIATILDSENNPIGLSENESKAAVS